MIPAADENLARPGLLLEVAFQAEVGIPLSQHLVVDGAMRVMTGGAAFPDGFVLKDEGPPLGDMALRAGINLGREGRAAALDGRSFVGIMTVAAAHVPLAHGMVAGQVETAFHIQVALEADLGRGLGVDDRAAGAPRFGVQAAGAVAAFAADIQAVLAFGHQPRMRGGMKAFVDVVMAFGATLRSHKLRARNRRRHQNGAVDRDAGDQACDGKPAQSQADFYSQAFPPGLVD